jgi:hypothetical protein
MPGFSEWSPGFRFRDKIFVRIYLSSYACYMPHPSQPLSFDHPNNTLVKCTSYVATHYAVFSSLLPLPPFYVQIFPSAPCSQTHNLRSSLSVIDQVWHPNRTRGRQHITCGRNWDIPVIFDGAITWRIYNSLYMRLEGEIQITGTQFWGGIPLEDDHLKIKKEVGR